MMEKCFDCGGLRHSCCGEEAEKVPMERPLASQIFVTICWWCLDVVSAIWRCKKCIILCGTKERRFSRGVYYRLKCTNGVRGRGDTMIEIVHKFYHYCTIR